MIAFVVPSIRTPRGVDGFDYDVPEGMQIQVGDLVWIPFRNKRIVGLVHDVTSQAATDKPRKPIDSLYAEMRLSDRTVRLLDALAVRSFTSKPSILHAWLGTLPKKPAMATTKPLQPSLMPVHEERYLSDHWLAANGVVNASKNGKRVLILTPWASRATWLADRCDAALLTSELASGARYKAWSSFLRGETRVLVATRVGAWLAAEADLVVLDEPENDDHKQDELSPRFDVRWMVDEASHSGVSVISIGLTPRLTTDHEPRTLQSPTIDVRLSAIDINRRDWSPISGLQQRSLNILEDALTEGRSAFIIHPIHGDRARVRCADCGWTAACARCGAGLTIQGTRMICQRCHETTETTLMCPACGGQDLSRSRPGREKLIKDLETIASHEKVHVHSIGEWNDRTELPDNALVILTDLSLLPGGGEDARRKERLIIAFRRLADICRSANAELIVQSDPLMLTDAKTWLTGSGCADALRHESAERAQFQLPPSARLIKIIVRDSEQSANDLIANLKTRVASLPTATLSGPYPVLYRPSTQTGRWIVHLTVPAETPDTAILDVLHPVLATDALIDLDPIAFFE